MLVHGNGLRRGVFEIKTAERPWHKPDGPEIISSPGNFQFICPTEKHDYDPESDEEFY